MMIASAQLRIAVPHIRSARACSGVRLSARRLPIGPRPLTIVRAETDTTEASQDVDKVLADVQAKWDAIENKPAVAAYAGGAVVLLWLSSTLVGAVNNVPLLPKVLELIGLAYSSWFTYRYLLFKSSREELATDIEDLKKRISGSAE